MSTITATQHIDIRNDSFFSILSILTEDDRIFLLVFLINPIRSHSYNFEYTPHHRARFFGDACAGPPGGIQPERRRHWRFLSC